MTISSIQHYDQLQIREAPPHTPAAHQKAGQASTDPVKYLDDWEATPEGRAFLNTLGSA